MKGEISYLRLFLYTLAYSFGLYQGRTHPASLLTLLLGWVIGLVVASITLELLERFFKK